MISATEVSGNIAECLLDNIATHADIGLTEVVLESHRFFWNNSSISIELDPVSIRAKSL
jgi:hypothetical protein